MSMNINVTTPMPVLSSAPTSPTAMLADSTKFMGTAMLETGDVVQKFSTGSSNRSSRLNLEGSWLDLDSDDEDDSSPKMRRKNSAASGKGSKSTLAGIKELTRRSSMHLRKLTNKISTNH